MQATTMITAITTTKNLSEPSLPETFLTDSEDNNDCCFIIIYICLLGIGALFTIGLCLLSLLKQTRQQTNNVDPENYFEYDLGTNFSYCDKLFFIALELLARPNRYYGTKQRNKKSKEILTHICAFTCSLSLACLLACLPVCLLARHTHTQKWK